MSSLETMFNDSWVCSAEVSCNDICVATAQLNVDTITLTASMETVAPTRKSDLVLLHFINPETYVVESLTDLLDPVEVKLVLNEPVDMDTYDYKASWHIFCDSLSKHNQQVNFCQSLS